MTRSIIAGLAALAALALPASAFAQAQTFGSPLTAPANLPIGCDQKPIIINVNGDYGPSPGAADCTWRQSGVFAGAPTDPRFSSVPGDGTITRVEVLASANPAPLRFVVLSQLGNLGGTENFQCCFFQSETAPVALTPNVVNTFNVNIPVQRNTLDGIRRFDLMAISAEAGGGRTLPLAQVAPRINNFDMFQPGSVNAGFFYPRMSANGQDQGGGRREEGVPGVEVLVRWTWQPPGVAQQPGGGGGGGQVIGPVGPALNLRGAAPVRDNRALIPLICNGDAACAGQLQLLARAAGAAGKKKKAKPKSYGSAPYSVPAGGKATVKIKLNKAGKKALKGKKKGLWVTLKLQPKGGAAVTSKVKIKR